MSYASWKILGPPKFCCAKLGRVKQFTVATLLEFLNPLLVCNRLEDDRKTLNRAIDNVDEHAA